MVAVADQHRTRDVGARHHDVEGAAEHDVPTILVTWGYGEPAEHVGAVAVASDVREVADLLGVDLVTAPVRGAA